MNELGKKKTGKVDWKPGTILNPVPVVMVSCASESEKPNIITLAWVGTINSDPPMVSISIRKERHSHKIISESMEFAINLVTKDLTRATDYCGVKSGKIVDKFAELGLTPIIGSKIKTPYIEESPVNIECKVRQIIELGSHDMFIAEIVAVHVDEDLLDESDKLMLDKAGLVCYNHGQYHEVGKQLGFFGYSVRKKKVIKREIKQKSQE